MARVEKIDNSIKKRLERSTGAKRQIGTRDQVVYFLIVCEGTKTEPNYFIELEKDLPKGIVKLVIEGSGLNTLSLVDCAIKIRESSIRNYDRVWAVFDRDDFPEDNFNAAIYKALGNGINCAWSNQAFELWFLLHFQYVNVAMNRDKFKEYLEIQVRKASGNDKYIYTKNSFETYSVLKNYGNKDQAIKWSNKLLSNYSDERYAKHNPCTLVHLLIGELQNPQKVLNDLNKEI
ncbi:MAG: RloB domain-containing protein [Cyclobacteriaceae bacterium]|nr:RloB domain-containing protein [Cyclobacteriaceae bacterium]